MFCYNVIASNCGGVAKRLNAADCKSAPIGFGGSKPSPSTIYIKSAKADFFNILYLKNGIYFNFIYCYAKYHLKSLYVFDIGQAKGYNMI